MQVACDFSIAPATRYSTALFSLCSVILSSLRSAAWPRSPKEI